MSDISMQIAELADSLERVQAIQVVINSREPVAMVNEQGRGWIVAGLRKLAADNVSAMRSGNAIEAAAGWLMQDDSAYEAQPDAARRAAKEMLYAADSADDRVPHATQNVRCDECDYRWIAVAPAMTVGPFECPVCRRMAGELDET